MRADQIYFDAIKEPREGYFVEYHPPRVGDRFAMVNLCLISPMPVPEIVTRMERELQEWMGRYPIPVMGTAFSPDESVLSLEPTKPCNHLIGVIAEGKIRLEWRLLKNEELQQEPLTPDDLLRLFGRIPHRTQQEINQKLAAEIKQTRMGKKVLGAIFLTWLVIIPATVAIIGWKSPFWGAVALVYSLFQATMAGLKFSGYVKPSVKEKQKHEKQREMEHFYYHCKLNPDGFLRLKSENFQRETTAKALREAQALGMAVELPSNHQEANK
jgi:hypothetical protein